MGTYTIREHINSKTGNLRSHSVDIALNVSNDCSGQLLNAVDYYSVREDSVDTLVIVRWPFLN